MSRSTSSRHTERLTQLWYSEPKKRVNEEMKGGNREAWEEKNILLDCSLVKYQPYFQLKFSRKWSFSLLVVYNMELRNMIDVTLNRFAISEKRNKHLTARSFWGLQPCNFHPQANKGWNIFYFTCSQLIWQVNPISWNVLYCQVN